MKNIRFELRTTRDERLEILRLAKLLKVKSKAETIRRAVAIALQVTEPQRDQFHNVQPT